MANNKNSIKLLVAYMLSCVVLFSSCDSDFEIPSDTQDFPEEIIENEQNSLIFLPIQLSISDLEHRINAALKPVIIDESEFEDRNGIPMKLKILKQGNLTLSDKNGRLQSKLPLGVTAQVLIEQTILGLKVKAQPYITLNLTVITSSGLRFGNNWSYNVDTQIEDIIWDQQPVLRAGPIQVDLSDPLEKMIRKQEKELSKVLAEEMKKNISLQQEVGKVMTKIKRYNKVDTKQMILWMRVTPKKLYLAKQPIFKNDSISLTAGLDVKMDMESFKANDSTLDLRSLEMGVMDKMPEQFDLKMRFSLNYLKLDSLIDINLRKVDLSTLPFGLEIETIKSGRYDKNKFYLACKYRGRGEGILFLSGNVQYDSLNKQLYMENVDLNINSDNFLHRIAFWWGKDKIEDALKDKLFFPLDPLFGKVQESVIRMFHRIAKQGDIEIQFKDLQYTINDIHAFDNSAEIQIRIKGESALKLDINQ